LDRRRFIDTFAGGLLAAPLAAEAQPAGKVYRIGYLAATTALSRPVGAFRQGLREFGWVEGQNIAIEYRFAEGRLDRLPDLAAELVRLKVDVIVAGPTAVALRDRKQARDKDAKSRWSKSEFIGVRSTRWPPRPSLLKDAAK
jgi:putative ABC transport system substrate-binding protein